jgi:hypothetical protein
VFLLWLANRQSKDSTEVFRLMADHRSLRFPSVMSIPIQSAAGNKLGQAVFQASSPVGISATQVEAIAEASLAS